jgi:hypothetical protein
MHVVQETVVGNIVGGTFGGLFLALAVVGYRMKKQKVHETMRRVRRSMSLSSGGWGGDAAEIEGPFSYQMNRKTGEFTYIKTADKNVRDPVVDLPLSTSLRAVWEDEEVESGIKKRTNRATGMVEYIIPMGSSQ